MSKYTVRIPVVMEFIVDADCEDYAMSIAKDLIDSPCEASVKRRVIDDDKSIEYWQDRCKELKNTVDIYDGIITTYRGLLRMQEEDKRFGEK